MGGELLGRRGLLAKVQQGANEVKMQTMLSVAFAAVSLKNCVFVCLSIFVRHSLCNSHQDS